VRDRLQKLGLADDTLIVYMGDNGYLHGEHGLIDKRVMHEPSIRVPLLMECPSLIRKPVAISQMALNIDIAPTLLDLAGAPVPPQMQGRSLMPLLRGETPDWRKDFVYVYFWEREAPMTPTIMGLRTEKHSYMQSYGVWDRWELYDIVQDPDQRHNLLGEALNGMEYGRLERFVREPGLKKVQSELQARLVAEVQRLGGRVDPEWSAPAR
jgi:N-acetylglucosamine-6-sulfatase